MTTTLDDLINSCAGRGVWIGLFASTLPPNVVAHEVKDLHLTLAHLGRDKGPDLIRRAHDACTFMLTAMPAVSAKIDGTARLEQKAGSAIVFLLRDEELRASAGMVHAELGRRAVWFDKRFPFRPHVTIRKLDTKSIAAIERIDPSTVIPFDMLGLVVGDNRITWPLVAPQAQPF